MYHYLQGIWLISNIEYENQDVMSDFLNNAIEFKDKKATIPGRTYFEVTSWKLNNNNGVFSINFNTKDKVYKNEFTISFIKEEGHDKMLLISTTTKIKCSKW
jgi:hypothetical protein